MQSRCRAATELDNVPDSSYVALSTQTQFASSGYVSVNGGQVFGSGTLIAPNWVLTAAHVVTQDTTGIPAFLPSQITFGQGSKASGTGSYSISQVIVEPGWSYNLATGDDLALLELSTPDTSVAPAVIYNSSLGSELGQIATIVGYGKSGTGLTGDTLGAGTRRAITNTIDSFGGQAAGGLAAIGMSSNLMFTDFDQPNNSQSNIMGSATPTAYEGASAPGDSGGGLFLTVNNQTYLAGVTDFLGALPTNLLSPNPDGHYGDYNGYTRVSVSQSMSFIDSALVPTSVWGDTGGGTWNATANWGNGIIPNYAGSSAVFGGTITAASTVTLDSGWTIGNLDFSSTNAYTLSPGSLGTLTLDNGGAGATATVTDSSGTQCINVPVVLNSNVQMTVVNAGDTVNVWGAVSGTGGLTILGSGSVTLSGSNSYQGPTTISSGTLNIKAAGALPTGGSVVNNGALNVIANTNSGSITGSGILSIGTSSAPAILKLASGSGLSAQSSVAISSGSTLDIGNNAFAINYAGTSPEATIAALLTSGYNGGTWTGTGITSSAAANLTHLSVGYADGSLDAGVSVPANQVLVMYTLAGDANLDGSVNFTDLAAAAQRVNTTGNDWAQGDFTYASNGYVGFNDLFIIAQNMNMSLATLPVGLGGTGSGNIIGDNQIQFDAMSLPEPTAGVIGSIGALLMLGRRRRKMGLKIAI